MRTLIYTPREERKVLDQICRTHGLVPSAHVKASLPKWRMFVNMQAVKRGFPTHKWTEA